LIGYLSYHGWHCVRKFRSLGVEDVVALKKFQPNLFIQAKNSISGPKAMSDTELETLMQHADEYGCIGIFVYTHNRKKYWYNTMTKEVDVLDPIPQKIFKQWSIEVNKIKEQKGIKSCNCVINPQQVFMRLKNKLSYSK
jgi:hypothetical protein